MNGKDMEPEAIEFYDKIFKLADNVPPLASMQATVNFISNILANIAIDHKVPPEVLIAEVMEDIKDCVKFKLESYKVH